MGFVDYYLIVWDFINYAKTNGIPVGPGRGSGAGSVIAYLIGITEVEPFRYNLMFERFLNPQRKSMPDFDVDFCMDRRGEVIDYVHKKYGSDNVCQIVTFGTMAAKNAIRDVARVLRLPIAESNRLAKMVPDNFKYTLKHLLGLKKYKKEGDTYISEELKQAYNDPATHKVIDIAMRIEGSPRQTGMHAAGVVICREKVSDHVPLQTNGGSAAKGGHCHHPIHHDGSGGAGTAQNGLFGTAHADGHKKGVRLRLRGLRRQGGFLQGRLFRSQRLQADRQRRHHVHIPAGKRRHVRPYAPHEADRAGRNHRRHKLVPSRSHAVHRRLYRLQIRQIQNTLSAPLHGKHSFRHQRQSSAAWSRLCSW